ncbi:hypothetical protein NDI76_01960 [Halogeometricum sp. S1BR25-6]|uniref:Halobacterial output domain-containing protein n=1 Tax=Halogeometricum salsisoli TaxID=2950536 RepID=A0ABU2G9N8_9EURY|nr:HalOD1 output domain-containing protein [Halogeometricum sp. S1BR25-6]MDS0297506.1 hypothetical protein [Halogeometricum sp. S1BR25-6]
MTNDTTTADSDTLSTDKPPREPLLHDIVSRVAAANDCDPLDLRPVSEVVDPEALETLLVESDAAVTVRFPYEGGLVRVSEASVTFEFGDETAVD